MREVQTHDIILIREVLGHVNRSRPRFITFRASRSGIRPGKLTAVRFQIETSLEKTTKGGTFIDSLDEHYSIQYIDLIIAHTGRTPTLTLLVACHRHVKA